MVCGVRPSSLRKARAGRERPPHSTDTSLCGWRASPGRASSSPCDLPGSSPS
eukprot:CAMPEP_0118943426 /NCGR_PEP_ID=MMETSP1169-20130426/38290_1 /TAXON_ID=36882 /ORGANISM="Pyramimonas obovata, Strain CCMP722" /LENGTH=51 /DNA_ID=CAMNT_0006888675 /DNA_START=343 /DNA_END=498 /DNA_ORIENTATION=-